MREFNAARAKLLIPPGSGPYAIMLECEPHALIQVAGAAEGRYEVVLAGSASVSGHTLQPPGLRYVHGDERAQPIEVGADGATIMLLEFDRDAREGGLTGDRLSVAAAAAMERAI